MAGMTDSGLTEAASASACLMRWRTSTGEPANRGSVSALSSTLLVMRSWVSRPMALSTSMAVCTSVRLRRAGRRK